MTKSVKSHRVEKRAQKREDKGVQKSATTQSRQKRPKASSACLRQSEIHKTLGRSPVNPQ